MGLDPQTHKPLVSCGTAMKSPASPTTRHMAQWESARLEAEARLSRETSLFHPSAPGKTDSDYFLRMWNSEVGETFRRFNQDTKVPCQSPVSQASSSTKGGSVSALTADIGHNLGGSFAAASDQTDEKECKSCKSYAEDLVAGPDSSSSTGLEDSSDNALQLLLDFPINNDMSFLEENTDDYATSAMSTKASLICPL
uniref:Uncharacterized protein n=1 Tax=Rhizophora mucronata TaxID=61149 RepID=A0A2P2IPY2_RHIMU